MQLEVLNKDGQPTGQNVALDASVFGIEPNDHAIYLDVRQYLANQRQGTHKSKERAEIAGSTRKIKRQKGTGTARAGSIKSPVFKGGGRIFGPRPRDYRFKLNKKVKQLARRSALSYKAQDNAVLILDEINFDKPQTKGLLSILENLNLVETVARHSKKEHKRDAIQRLRKTLVVVGEADRNAFLSARNLPRAKVVIAEQLNTYDILHADALVMLPSAVDKINSLLSKTPKES
ncbi:MAG: 50S ribosomal protein L4 [Bernardetiaceae bacterium]|nr:50S ribosomal protein L4 [Bernardetiaceae bacterium]